MTPRKRNYIEPSSLIYAPRVAYLSLRYLQKFKKSIYHAHVVVSINILENYTEKNKFKSFSSNLIIIEATAPLIFAIHNNFILYIMRPTSFRFSKITYCKIVNDYYPGFLVFDYPLENYF